MPDECLGTQTLVDVLEGRADAASRMRVDRHAAECIACREVLSSLARSGTPPVHPRSSDDDPVLAPGTQLGRYVIEHELGTGGMGVVYAAYDPELDRTIAIKLLRAAGDPRLQDWLRREALAMAQLAHPNVVAVHDVGAFEGRMFLAMEHVPGETLTRWLATPRAPRDILAVCCAAGRGLAAAHAGGVIHRDFKPDNVLIGDDGRVRVCDFGLARTLDVDDPVAARARGDAHAQSAASVIVGTPAYMAPEQLAGQRATAASDQFSYGVTVYEALVGARPFSGDSIDALADDIRGGLTTRQALPPALKRCLTRMLDADPDARWPVMTDAVDALERVARQPARRRRAIIASAGVAAIAIGAIAFSGPSAAEAERASTAQRAAALWSPTRAALMQARFAATGSPLAAERYQAASQHLARYVGAWTQQRDDAWAATHARNEQTPEQLALRLACFDRLAQTADGLVELLRASPARDVEDAPQSVDRLEPVATCGNVDRLAARSFAPSTIPGMLAERQLWSLEATQIAGRFDEALQRARALVDAAGRLDEPGVLARARFNLGWAQNRTGHLVEAEATLHAAIQEAATARDHYLVAESWLLLLDVSARQLGHLDVADELQRAATAAVAQAGNDPRQRADLAKVRGLLARVRNDLTATLAAFTEARDRRVAARGPDDAAVAGDECNLASILMELDRNAEATARFERAIAIIHATYGEHHPTLAQAEHGLASIAAAAEDWPTAERHARNAVALNLAMRGPNHPDTARNRTNLARILRLSNKFDDARAELALARAIYRRILPETDPNVISIDVQLAQIASAEGKFHEAAELAAGAVALARRGNAQTTSLPFSLREQARAVAHYAPAEALPLYLETMPIGILVKGRPAKEQANALRELAQIALDAHQPEAALPWFARMPEGAAQLGDLERKLRAARH